MPCLLRAMQQPLEGPAIYYIDAIGLHREFQEEVEERARKELAKEVESSGTSTGAQYQATSANSDATIYRSNGNGYGSKPAVIIATPPDLQVSSATGHSCLRFPAI